MVVPDTGPGPIKPYSDFKNRPYDIQLPWMLQFTSNMEMIQFMVDNPTWMEYLEGRAAGKTDPEELKAIGKEMENHLIEGGFVKT